MSAAQELPRCPAAEAGCLHSGVRGHGRKVNRTTEQEPGLLHEGGLPESAGRQLGWRVKARVRKVC